MFAKSALIIFCTAVSAVFLPHGAKQDAVSNSSTATIVAQESSTAPLAQETTVAQDALASGSSVYSSRQRQDRGIESAAKKLRAAKTDSEKRAAEAKLRQLLSADYDSRLDDYEKHLDALAQQLKGMRAKLQKRRSAKADMIDLRVKVLKAEADDLGWPARVNRGRFPSLRRTGGGGGGFGIGGTTGTTGGQRPNRSR